MKKIVKGAVLSQIILDDVTDLAVFDIPAGSKVDSIAVINKSGVAGNIKLGAFTAESGGAFEKQTLTVSEAATAAGVVDVVLNGAAAVSITLAEGDTPEVIAGKIAAGTFTGWAATAVGAVVTFVATTATVRNGAYTFTDTGTTGAAATFARVTAGVAAIAASVGEQLVASEALPATANTGKGLTIVAAGSLFINAAKVGVGISSATLVKLSIGLRQVL